MIHQTCFQTCGAVTGFLQDSAKLHNVAELSAGATTGIVFVKRLFDETEVLSDGVAIVLLPRASAQRLAEEQRAVGLEQWTEIQAKVESPLDEVYGANGVSLDVLREAEAEFGADRPLLQPQRRPSLLSAFVSNCRVPWRNEALKQIIDALGPIQAQSFGRCLNNVGRESDRSSKGAFRTKQDRAMKFKVNFAFENKDDEEDYGTFGVGCKGALPWCLAQ
jgi:hypothetical protein